MIFPLAAQTLALVVAVLVVMKFHRLLTAERLRVDAFQRLLDAVNRDVEKKHKQKVEMLEFRADLAEHGLRAILEGGALNHTTVNSYEPRTPCDCQACKALHNVKVVFKIGEFAEPQPAVPSASEVSITASNDVYRTG